MHLNMITTIPMFLALTLILLIQSHANPSSNLFKRARDWQCGQIKSSDKNFPNQCICFDAAGVTTVAGESTAVVAYANVNGFRYPASTSNNGNCQVPDGGPVTLNPYSTTGKCCSFTCTYGQCGTVCLNQGQACRSGVPISPLKRRINGDRCPEGLTSCLTKVGGKDVFECIDTNRDLESCGGCTSPDPRLDNSTAGVLGRDCSEIPHASGVTCNNGQCVVNSCVRGYTAAGDRCVRSLKARARSHTEEGRKRRGRREM
ncbi:hypothetical protein FFLO_06073 [Filobasidium floriforme]|uniref:Protein CPL1-like domain-containing protein n=1 Tax=Filobasidium floriforme TaxID=5210 RepID=A0A8K0JH12_9TREE|nr:uncharacterized protein HD553DRAFT_319540 [Filobasidium floriforme]KAG7528587.1 hypothetical protein FFLO_06073 [Filobasidium floriforme]KAH8078670.1 hypothetical protein HD553DRAFT_319540 [Filobasidium floriforme]